jgi:formylglycine-generating enzyme required for sulfatase activity
VLYDHDRDWDTKHDQILANGSIRLKPDFNFSLRVQNFELQELSFIAIVEETAKLAIEAKAELPFMEEKTEIARYTFSPITIMVGPVPVVLSPVLIVNVGIDGSVYVGLRSEVTQQATLRAGLRYAGAVWTPVTDFSNQFNCGSSPTLQSTLGVEAKAYAGAQLVLRLYGLAGPYAEIDAYLKLDVDVAASPWWTLYGGLEVPVGVRMEVLGRELADYDVVAIGYRLVLAQAQANNPPNVPFSPSPVDSAMAQSVNVDLSWSGDDPDDDAMTYDVYLEADDTTPDVRVSDDQSGLAYDPGILSSNTHYYWRIVAQDEHGATNAGPVWDFTTGEATTCPIHLTLHSPQITGLTATVSGTVTSDCATITRLNWQWGDGASDDQWFPASHTYAISGTYPITVTAYNDLGDTEVAYTTAYVGLDTGEMVLVPAGEFQMGCDDGNPNEDCYSDEQPLHTVYLDAYTIDKYEVTNAQYAEFLNVMGNQEEGGDTWLDADDGNVRIHESGGVWQVDSGYENHPVVEVTWYGARAYCQWRGKRLPTEAEWEKAARGSSDTRMYPWGNEDPDCSRLNYFHYDGSSYEYCVGDTTPVGSYPTGASPYGAMDMAGNVWEWVNDWYDGDYYSSSPYENPPGPASGSYKVLRGGSFSSGWNIVRVAYRYDDFAVISFARDGFRCGGSGAPGY